MEKENHCPSNAAEKPDDQPKMPKTIEELYCYLRLDFKKEMAALAGQVITRDEHEKVLERVSVVEQEIAKLKDDLAENGQKMEKGVGEQEFTKAVSKAKIELKEEMVFEMNEAMEKERRKNNLVVFGLPEDETETLTNDLMGIIAPEAEYQMGRIGKAGISANPRPLHLTFSNYSSKMKALSNCRKLKGEEKFNGVSVQHDRTITQRRLGKTSRPKPDSIKPQQECSAEGGKESDNGTNGTNKTSKRPLDENNEAGSVDGNNDNNSELPRPTKRLAVASTVSMDTSNESMNSQSNQMETGNL